MKTLASFGLRPPFTPPLTSLRRFLNTGRSTAGRDVNLEAWFQRDALGGERCTVGDDNTDNRDTPWAGPRQVTPDDWN